MIIAENGPLLYHDDEILERAMNLYWRVANSDGRLQISTPKIMNEVFQVKSPAPYYLKDKNELCSINPKTMTYGTQSVSFMAPKIWQIVLQELKNHQSLYRFIYRKL